MIHPRHRFLSENSHFTRACADEGLTGLSVQRVAAGFLEIQRCCLPACPTFGTFPSRVRPGFEPTSERTVQDGTPYRSATKNPRGLAATGG